MASGLYLPTFRDIFDATQLAVDPLADTIRVALFTSSYTPDFASDSAYSATNEVGDSGDYAAGGQELGSKTMSSLVTSQLAFDAADPSWTGATITARGAMVYDDDVSDVPLCYIDFGGNESSVAGTFGIQFSASGIFYLDLY